jgi:hypothetical protein
VFTVVEQNPTHAGETGAQGHWKESNRIDVHDVRTKTVTPIQGSSPSAPNSCQFTKEDIRESRGPVPPVKISFMRWHLDDQTRLRMDKTSQSAQRVFKRPALPHHDVEIVAGRIQGTHDLQEAPTSPADDGGVLKENHSRLHCLSMR